MKCPICGGGELVRDTRDIVYIYKGVTKIISKVTADFCAYCEESITETKETERVMSAMMAFQKEVNATLVDTGFITQVRKKLGLGQKEAAEIFGGGVNAFSRYETGKTRPPVALVKLLKLLDRHPDLLPEIKIV